MDSRETPLDLVHIKSFTGQILDGLAYCHSMGKYLFRNLYLYEI